MVDYTKTWAEEPMKKPKVAKVVANIGVGSGGDNMKPAIQLLEKLTGKKPVQTYSKHKIPAWGLRLGLPIGTKVTLRGKEAEEFLKRSFTAVENTIKEKNFDNVGNLTFGIEQYVFYDNMKYDPDIGTMGLQISVTLERPGFRIKKRKVKKSSIGKKHLIPKEEAIAFIRTQFKVNVENGQGS
jgi:large subunit ribosomal protein L5